MTPSPSKSALLAVALTACSQTVSVEGEAVETVEQDGQQVFSHATLDAVLSEHVDERGNVAYAALKADRERFDTYVGQLAEASPASHPDLFPTRDHEMAYWINAYNALAIRAVLDAYPTESITDIMAAHGAFNRLKFPVGGQPMTLDDIEKGTLLKQWPDTPEIHWAVTCASMGCPGLDREAWTADQLPERLQAEGRAYLDSDRGVQIDTKAGVVRLAKYFDWYGDDFGDDHLGYVRPFLSEQRRARLDALDDPSIEYLEYDWRLNDQGAPWTKD